MHCDGPYAGHRTFVLCQADTLKTVSMLTWSPRGGSDRSRVGTAPATWTLCPIQSDWRLQELNPSRGVGRQLNPVAPHRWHTDPTGELGPLEGAQPQGRLIHRWGHESRHLEDDLGWACEQQNELARSQQCGRRAEPAADQYHVRENMQEVDQRARKSREY